MEKKTPPIIRWITAMEKMKLPVSQKTYQKAMMLHSEYYPTASICYPHTLKDEKAKS